jgi:hypothetical protein
MLTSSQVIADNAYKGIYNKKAWQKQKEQDKEYRKHREKIARKAYRNFAEQSRHNYEKRPDYHKHPGYRKRPYDQWDRYARKHPQIYEHGGYYRQNTHLMFRFCEPGTGNCFYFSIGR